MGNLRQKYRFSQQRFESTRHLSPHSQYNRFIFYTQLFREIHTEFKSMDTLGLRVVLQITVYFTQVLYHVQKHSI